MSYACVVLLSVRMRGVAEGMPRGLLKQHASVVMLCENITFSFDYIICSLMDAIVACFVLQHSVLYAWHAFATYFSQLEMIGIC